MFKKFKFLENIQNKTVKKMKNPENGVRSLTWDIDNSFSCTKNQVHGLCVGGDMSILFFGEVFREKRPPRENAKINFLKKTFKKCKNTKKMHKGCNYWFKTYFTTLGRCVFGDFIGFSSPRNITAKADYSRVRRNTSRIEYITVSEI